MPGTFALVTFGCRVNQYDSRAVAQALLDEGWCEVPPEQAEAVIVNVCSVTAKACRKARHKVYSLSRRSQGRIFVMGCLPPEESAKLLRLPKVWAFVPATQREYILGAVKGSNSRSELPAVRSTGERTRAIVKVQDGCGRRCTYCIIPALRGRPRWRGIEEVREEIGWLLGEGVPEVWLVGTDLSAWGGGKLWELLRRLDPVFQKHGGRLRLGTLSCDALTEELKDCLAEFPWICPYLHLSLQSGSPFIRRRMGRRLEPERIYQLIEGFYSRIKDLTFGADILVGFPGETESDFRLTCEFVERVKFINLHVFPFSPRPGTAAWGLPDKVPFGVCQERVKRLIDLGKALWRKKAEELVGQTVEVVFERKAPGAEGFSQHYFRVFCREGDVPAGRIVPVRVVGVLQGALEGTLLSEEEKRGATCFNAFVGGSSCRQGESLRSQAGSKEV